MQNFFDTLKTQFLKIWQSLSKTQKTIYISIISIVFIVIIALVFSSKSESYTPLFNQKMTMTDIGEITKILGDSQYKYRYDSNLKKLFVLSNQKNEIMLKLASENKLPKSSVKDFSIFDGMSYGSTEFEKKIALRRAIEGQLTRMLEQLNSIKSAKVGINMPESKFFIDQNQPSECSIVLELKPYEKLSNAQIKGILNIASYYIPNLKPENISLVNTEGIPLTDFLKNEKGTESKIERQLKIKKQWENELKMKISRALGKLGMDKIRAEVTLSIDWNRMEQTSEEYSFSGFDPIKISDQTEKEKFEGKGFKQGGRPGIDANIPVYKSGDKYPIKYERESEQNNYQPNKKITTQVKNPAITKITASVLIDGLWDITERKNKVPLRKYKHRTKEELNSYKKIVEGVLGIDTKRGDKVEVEEVKFNRTEEFAAMDKAIKMRIQKERLFKVTVLGIVGIVIIFIVLYELHKRWQLRKEELMRKRDLAAQDEMLGRSMLLEAELTPEERERLELLKHAQETAQKDPEMVAALLRTWIMEE